MKKINLKLVRFVMIYEGLLRVDHYFTGDEFETMNFFNKKEFDEYLHSLDELWN